MTKEERLFKMVCVLLRLTEKYDHLDSSELESNIIEELMESEGLSYDDAYELVNKAYKKLEGLDD